MSTLRTITAFKSKLSGGGARPNLFEVELPSFPEAAGGNTWRTGDNQESDTFKFLCKAAALPASNIAQIDVPFRGRIFKVAGDRTFDVWQVTVINDEDFKLRTAFEEWMNQISKLDNNLGATDPSAYMTNATVFQLGRGSAKNSKDNAGSSNAVLKEYEFVDIFPTAVSAIDLSYDSSDAIEEFTVDFQVQSFNLVAGGSPNG